MLWAKNSIPPEKTNSRQKNLTLNGHYHHVYNLIVLFRHRSVEILLFFLNRRLSFWLHCPFNGDNWNTEVCPQGQAVLGWAICQGWAGCLSEGCHTVAILSVALMEWAVSVWEDSDGEEAGRNLGFRPSLFLLECFVLTKYIQIDKILCVFLVTYQGTVYQSGSSLA